MTTPASRGLLKRRFFWRVYLHGIGLFILSVVAVIGAVAFVIHIFPRSEHWVSELAMGSPAVLEDPAGLTRKLMLEREHTGVKMTVYRMDGTLIASNSDPPLPRLAPGELKHLLRGELGFRALHPGSRFAVALPNRYQPVAYVQVVRSMTIRSAEQAGVVALSVLVVLALGSIPLARAISSPLERLTASARAFGEGDLQVRSGIRRKDEIGMLAAAFDEMAGRLQRLVRSEQELLANVSHELRTPLARIRVALDLAADAEPIRNPRYLQEIQLDLVELEKLVGDILLGVRLNLSGDKAGDGLPPLHRERIDAGALIDRSARHFRDTHPGRQLEVVIDLADPNIEADPALLRRAIDNLLENASKYSDDSQPITLTARSSGSEVVVEVQDRGIGIDPADLGKLFTPFFRTDRSRARRTGGIGLGLALAKRIVEAHRGSIGVHSSPGEGSTFRFSVPQA
jgi:signal transduction histidine kinase